MAFTLRPRGAFSLAAAASFAEGFPGTDAQHAHNELQFAWPVDEDWRTVAVALRQSEEGVVRGELAGTPPSDLARRARGEVEQILSLDVDGKGFIALGDRDPVVAALQQRFAGLRPVLFFSPYEAAAWAIIGQRIRMTQAAVIKQRLATELGQHGGFPAPERLAALTAPQRGLTERKVGQLRELGTAALEGVLSRTRLRAMTDEQAARDLQQLAGIGPFSAELIIIRGVGEPDALPHHERRVTRAARAAYRLPDDADIEALAHTWRPYRTWVAVHLRTWLEAETGEITRGRQSQTPPALATP